MKLRLFDFIENVVEEYDRNQDLYLFAEERIRMYFESLMLGKADTSVVSLHTRIKTRESLKEKLLRNKFYLHFDDPKDVMMYLSDLIGITIECRFIRNEAELYKELFDHFEMSGKGFSRSRDDANIFMNMHMPQPQVQRNGFTIYRIDGYYLFEGNRINFELQIKSLVHRFWSEIEHEVIYKNPDFVFYDRFMKNMLGAVRDNLDVVDRQLEIMYTEISSGSRQVQIGMNQESFKIMMASSINEIVNRKMKESVGFSTDFKKCASILAQYIYVRDFINSDNARENMMDYLEHMTYLAGAELDFNSEILIDRYESDDPFCSVLGDYMMTMMNQDFEWHVFFVMLFAIQNDEPVFVFNDFLRVLRRLIIQPGWYREKFLQYEEEDALACRRWLTGILAEGMVRADTIEIIHEDRLFEVMQRFRVFVERTETAYPELELFEASRDELKNQLWHDLLRVFN